MRKGSMKEYDYLGKPGMTGLVQINNHDALSPEEIERYNVYYAKNQSFMLDLEILLKSFF
jgi:undecaprenyl phosphate N,N'-diacetylbacillosamine 1-phosphate transferase